MARLRAFGVSLARRLTALDNPSGQGLAEYALILALIAIISIVALIFLGGQISQIISRVGQSM
jgi:Flp pilus assembly pilin Flp